MASLNKNCPVRVIFSFNEDLELPYEPGAEKYLKNENLKFWQELKNDFGSLVLVPLFRSKTKQNIEDLVTQAKKISNNNYKTPYYELLYFTIDTPDNVNPTTLVKYLSIWSAVKVAYVEPPPIEPPAVNHTNDPLHTEQSYLCPAPMGIGAQFAWKQAGGAGQGQALVDIEQGWGVDHEDLFNIEIISGINHSHFSHGSSVLGIIAAQDNAKGIVGITPHLPSIRCVSQWKESSNCAEESCTAGAILKAISNLDFQPKITMNKGDILLLEAQTTLDGYEYCPVEIYPADFKLIQIATAFGIVVIEAAGNGHRSLNSIDHFYQENDSGAIIVAASKIDSQGRHKRLAESCYGSRINCYALGECVVTLSTDGGDSCDDPCDDDSSLIGEAGYTHCFKGTSSAAAIVAGAALAVQGMAQAKYGKRFSPCELREILSDPKCNTLPAPQLIPRHIGVMPDLKAIYHKYIENEHDITDCQ